MAADEARVADSIVVGVALVGVVLERAVVVGTRVRGETGITEAVAIGVGARIACVADAIVVAVLLQMVRYRLAVVRGVHDAIAVAILARIADPVGVPVCLGRIVTLRAVVAAVGHSIAIVIRMVIMSRADVARIAGAVAIGVRLVRVRNVWAVVRDVDHPVAVDILTSVADPVGVPVGLICVRNVGTVVAGVADPVAVPVGLPGVRDEDTVVRTVDHAIRVTIVRRTRAQLAGNRDGRGTGPMERRPCWYVGGEHPERRAIPIAEQRRREARVHRMSARRRLDRDVLDAIPLVARADRSRDAPPGREPVVHRIVIGKHDEPRP